MGRKPLIRNTEHQHVVDQLIASGWSSYAIAMYVTHRFGQTIEDSTVRRYRIDEESRIKKEYPELVAASEERVYVKEHIRSDQYVDVLGSLGELILLQRARVEVGLRMEASMAVPMEGNRREVETLAKLLEQYHVVLQDWGVAPKAGIDVRVSVPSVASSVGEGRLIDVLDEEDRENVISLSRAIHARTLTAGDESEA